MLYSNKESLSLYWKHFHGVYKKIPTIRCIECESSPHGLPKLQRTGNKSVSRKIGVIFENITKDHVLS